jgi:stearoyl-CoA desaturase (delta-9 desaturase)
VAVKPVCEQTLRAVIDNRYDVLSRYAKSLKRTYAEELARLKRWSPKDAEALKSLKRALLRMQRLSEAERARLGEVLKNSRALATVVAMRQELVAVWERSSASKDELVRQLQDWCHRAEASGIAPLEEFSLRLRRYT